MVGVIEKMVLVKVVIEKRYFEVKSEYLLKVFVILEVFCGCLDFEVGGEVIENLYVLYLYMIDCLLDVSIKNDILIIDEVFGLLKEIKLVWDVIFVEICN